MKTGIATMPLDTGRVPAWLFERMTRLMRIVTVIMVEEFGPEEFLRRISDPFWFQSISCAIGMDWNSSGTTPITLGALKEALRGLENELGIYVCGGKGKTSKKTPEHILAVAEKTGLPANKYINLSKLVAKVDNTLIQDGFQLYHHSFLLTSKGSWAVIQQGMNTRMAQARRYHWLAPSSSLGTKPRPIAAMAQTASAASVNHLGGHQTKLASTAIGSSAKRSDALNFNLTLEPHTGIVSNLRLKNVLNLTNKQSSENKNMLVDLVNEPRDLLKDLLLMAKTPPQKTLFLPDVEFHTHPVSSEKFNTKRLGKIIARASFLQPQTIEALLLIAGVGPATIRAISLVAELIYNKPVSRIDPARYTFAHGGKDGTPYPVDRRTYDETIALLNKALKKAQQTKIYVRT